MHGAGTGALAPTPAGTSDVDCRWQPFFGYHAARGGFLSHAVLGQVVCWGSA